jgi:hypothetical protein
VQEILIYQDEYPQLISHMRVPDLRIIAQDNRKYIRHYHAFQGEDDSDLKQMPNLRVLRCGSNANFTDEGLSHFQNLQELNMGFGPKFIETDSRNFTDTPTIDVNKFGKRDIPVFFIAVCCGIFILDF